MPKILIRGGNQLYGTVRASGAKNSVLPILAASILPVKGDSIIEDVPQLTDVQIITEVIENLGVKVQEIRPDALRLNAENLHNPKAPDELVRKMRASFTVLGPLLARFGQARVALPGGCAIGARPVDQHLKGLQALGAEIEVGHGFVDAKVPSGGLRGSRIYFDVNTVGGTQNVMMAAVLAKGQTFIHNAAREPEIIDLANYLNAMGAHVRGAGTDVIRIEGVDELHGANHTVIPDRIEVGTFLLAAAITNGDVYVEGAISNHLTPLLAKLREAGVSVVDDVKGIRVQGIERTLKPIDIKTLPYPGFPTDLQAQMMAFLTVIQGNSLVTETVFENRFMHVSELQRMGAEIKVEGRTAVVEGVPKLTGAVVTASDLRAGGALITAALAAQGVSEIHGLHHVDRGYVDIVGKLRSLGADIERDDEINTNKRIFQVV
ncbi:UDP-N-acetylglucosamine 1-carboxyvinyltransferase [Fodinisporobacter ferrooxydans]|uniref:UDP-N-acetylglucosamine 1-carboxyvinyltransferase n=1 Tax=Fodinisporobacter ferrooxydans TaxID=2901836 RepID=A0ABY4CM31_9BACL|nr:UDP-N-acetylglucosamine 1-carboxyvinyltransferase [Alicyclobacillaceae bacterium MYW30-H2]